MKSRLRIVWHVSAEGVQAEADEAIKAAEANGWFLHRASLSTGSSSDGHDTKYHILLHFTDSKSS